MSSNWIIRANDRNFGPYTLEQMQGFAAEGRLAPHSAVARDGDTSFTLAAEDPDLAAIFRPPAQSQRPVFFTAEGDLGRAQPEPETVALHRFLICADMKSRSISGLEEELHRSGQATALMPQAWLLASEMTLNALRNALVQRLGRIDMLFIVDITNNKAAWFNYGPESDSRIRRIWQMAQQFQAA